MAEQHREETREGWSTDLHQILASDQGLREDMHARRGFRGRNSRAQGYASLARPRKDLDGTKEWWE